MRYALSLVLILFPLLECRALEVISAPPSLCALTFTVQGGGSVFCSGTLIGPQAVVTASHCFSVGPKKIVGNVQVGCGLLRQNTTLEGFEFSVKTTASTVRVNSDKMASGDMGEDFAFLRLDQKVDSIEPMRLPASFSALKSEFFVPSATALGNNELNSTVQCRSSGFGVREGHGGRHFITSDQSPKSGLKAFLRDGSHDAKTLVVNAWGETIEPLRKGDSGGAFYCRSSPRNPWTLIASIVAYETRGTARTGGSFLALTASDSFLSFWRHLRSEWKQ